MSCSWEGNRRSGVALAMRRRLQWFVHLRAHGLEREMSTPPALLMGYGSLPYLQTDKLTRTVTMQLNVLSYPHTSGNTDGATGVDNDLAYC